MLDASIAEVSESIRLKPTHPFYHLRMGILLETKGDRNGAVAALEEALSLKPDLKDATSRLRRLKKSTAGRKASRGNDD